VKVAGVAIASDGRMFAATTSGQLAEWTAAAELRFFEATGPRRVRGIHAGPGGVVAMWGDSLVRWKGGGEPETITTAKVDGAVVRDDGSIVWWKGAELRLAKQKLRGLNGQIVSIDRARGHLVAVSASGLRRFDFATWPAKRGHAVRVWNLADGALLHELTVDRDGIDDAAFGPAGQLTIVYLERKRVAVFDANGKLAGRIGARELGEAGSAVEELFPLRRGLILAFAPYMRGDVFLVDAGARRISGWRLDNLYKGGKRFLADTGEKTLLGHTYLSTRLLRF
jgi:hypothetical protein